MEIEWRSLSERERAEFAAWRTMRQAKADAEALAAAEAKARGPRYVDMSLAEKRAFHRKNGFPMSHADEQRARAAEKRSVA